ncbi:MAG TPA: hypothetical protein EYN66_13700, partial [Myxococcales bacterium]|nr:hypothetical protein [Myxococcales bacterium]
MRYSVLLTLSFLLCILLTVGSCGESATIPSQQTDTDGSLDIKNNNEIPQVPDAEPDVQEEPNYQTCDEAADCDSTWC